MQEIQAIHNIEWEFRHYMAENSDWRIPNQLNACRYAADEASELRQAWMTFTSADPRNNRSKATMDDILAEAGDTLFMAMCAIGEDHKYGAYNRKYPEVIHLGVHIDRICWTLNKAIFFLRDELAVKSNLEHAVQLLVNIPGFDLAEAQIKWHKKIIEKNAPKHLQTSST